MKNTLVYLLASMLGGTGIVILFPQWSDAQWVQTAYPPTSTLTLATNGGNLFAGTSSSGVYLSANNGTSWTAVNTGLTNLRVNVLLANGGNIFAGTSGGVFLTTNNGTNWTAVNSGLTNLTVSALVANGGNVFAGTNGGGVFLTTNNGTSWTRVSNGLTNGTILSLAVNGGNVFAGTSGGGVFLTTNNGTNWTSVNTGLTALTIYTLVASGGNVFAGSNGGGVFLTTNNGTNWIDFNTGMTGIPYIGAFVTSGSYIFAGTGGSVFRRLLSDVGNLPAVPTLSSPANGATGVALSPTMAWNAATGATSYHLQVSTSSSFSTTVINDLNLTGTSRTISPLAGATTYYWRVNAKNATGTGWWSTVWSFTTIWSLPAAPVLSSPADAATIGIPNPTMTWNASIGAASYTLNVSTASNFSTLAVNQSNIVSTSRMVTGLSNNTTYYWRVNAVNPAGTSAWSYVRSFTMAFDTTPGLVAYWSFDSSSGNTYYDVTGHGYDATATGTGIGLVQGVKGQALICPGSGYDIAVANSNNNFNLTQFSIESWFYSNIDPSGIVLAAKILDFQYLPPSGGTRNGYTVYIDPNGHVNFGMSSSDGSAWEQAISSTVIAAQTWCFITATYDSSYLRIYVNGVLTGSLAYQGTYPLPGADARIGCQRRTDGGVSQFVNGRIDELKLYNYALPADSIAVHFITTAIKPEQKQLLPAAALKVHILNSLLTISLPSAMLGKAVDLAVYSVSGREIMRKRVQSGAERFTLPVGFSYGSYILVANDGSRKVSVRFVAVR